MTVTPFLKWNIEMKIQSQVLTMHTLTSLSRITIHERKRTHLRVISQKSTKYTASCRLQTWRKTSEFFAGAKQAFILAPAITLLVKVLSQKFPFLCRL